MSYYSDVRICTTNKGYEDLKKYVADAIKDEPEKPYLSLMDKPDVFYNKNNNVYMGWNSVNHFHDRPDGVAIMRGLNYISELGHSWRYSCIGEDLEDTEELMNDSNDDSDLVWPRLVRTFDDEDTMHDIDFCKPLQEQNQNL